MDREADMQNKLDRIYEGEEPEWRAKGSGAGEENEIDQNYIATASNEELGDLLITRPELVDDVLRELRARAGEGDKIADGILKDQVYEGKTEDKEESEEVVFRVWKGTNDVIALFPYMIVDDRGHIGSYEHIGQHGGADFSAVMDQTRPATPKEYEDLKDELERCCGYTLIVRGVGEGVDVAENKLDESTLDELKAEAEKTARWRGHKLGKWIDQDGEAYAECERDGCTAMVTVKPGKGYEIVGDAVAVGCPEKDESMKEAKTRRYTVTAYSFDELSDEAKKKVLEKMRDINVDFLDWFEPEEDYLKDELQNAGYIKPEIQFSGFWSQGDGASFTCKNIDLAALAEAVPAVKALLAKIPAEVIDNLEASVVRTEHRYSHANTVRADVGGGRSYSKDIDPIVTELEETITADVRARSNAIYKALEEAYEGLTSDESVIDTIKANEYEFTKSGELFNGVSGGEEEVGAAASGAVAEAKDRLSDADTKESYYRSVQQAAEKAMELEGFESDRGSAVDQAIDGNYWLAHPKAQKLVLQYSDVALDIDDPEVKGMARSMDREDLVAAAAVLAMEQDVWAVLERANEPVGESSQEAGDGKIRVQEEPDDTTFSTTSPEWEAYGTKKYLAAARKGGLGDNLELVFPGGFNNARIVNKDTGEEFEIDDESDGPKGLFVFAPIMDEDEDEEVVESMKESSLGESPIHVATIYVGLPKGELQSPEDYDVEHGKKEDILALSVMYLPLRHSFYAELDAPNDRWAEYVSFDGVESAVKAYWENATFVEADIDSEEMEQAEEDQREGAQAFSKEQADTLKQESVSSPSALPVYVFPEADEPLGEAEVDDDPYRIAKDTPLLPEMIAEAVVAELAYYLDKKYGDARLLNAEVQTALEASLIDRAERVYANNKDFHKKLNAAGDVGRDTLYMFMRHWLMAQQVEEDQQMKEYWDSDQALKDFGMGRELKAEVRESIDQHGNPVPSDLVVLPTAGDEWIIDDEEKVSMILSVPWYESNGILMASYKALADAGLPDIENDPLDAGIDVTKAEILKIDDALKRVDVADGFYHAW